MANDDDLTPTQRRRKKRRRNGRERGDRTSTGPDTGVYKSLMEEAIREGWTEEQFEQALYDSDEFADEFPGYFREDGSTPFGSAEDYRNSYDQYSHIAAQYGQSVSKERFSKLVHSSVSASEFDERLNVTDRINTLAKETPGGIKALSETLKSLGYGNGSPEDIFKFASKSALPELYDAYEATQIKATGLQIKGAGTMLNGRDQGIAELENITGLIDENFDIAGAVEEITSLRTDISPELRAAGIAESDLLKMKAGVEPTGDLANKVRQFIAQRRALGKSSVGKSTGFSDVGTFQSRNPGELDLNNG